MLNIFYNNQVKLIFLILFFISFVISNADDSWNHEYIDFSTDRSTLFFKLNSETNDTVFFDFFSPFDPTVKTEIYDPLVMYQLDNFYYFNDNMQLMIDIEELRKLYAPYFDFEIKDNKIKIQHTFYDKFLISGFKRRSTTIKYTKKVWNLNIDLTNKKHVIINHTIYKAAIGGRNKKPKFTDQIEKKYNKKHMNYKQDVLELKNKKLYIAANEIMKLMGKEVFKSAGYMHIQTKDLADVTAQVNRDDLDINLSKTIIPNAANLWHSGQKNDFNNNYKWADYMNEVISGKRKIGWLWKAFYIPSGENFVDKDGIKIKLKADRIVPYTIYVPVNYDKKKTKLLFMLHGGTGNENTPTYRLLLRDMPIDSYLEEYNYILVSPNGWTQNPMWREGQAFYSFNKSADLVINKYKILEDKIFITGNSMGGKGTLEIAMRKPEMFKAIAPTAMKITNRSRDKKTYINIDDTKYNLKNISSIPTFIAQGTADSTTSFKTQIGNKQKQGAIVKAIMPKLHNALYVTVEQGSHSYAYGSILPIMFDFFESTFDEKYEKSKQIIKYFDIKNLDIKNLDNHSVISLSELKNYLASDFKTYSISSYNKSAKDTVNYYTAVYKGNSINFNLNNRTYRRNMERYKEDADVLKKGKNNDAKYLDSAPKFSITPYEKANKIYIPVIEFLNALNVDF